MKNIFPILFLVGILSCNQPDQVRNANITFSEGNGVENTSPVGNKTAVQADTSTSNQSDTQEGAINPNDQLSKYAQAVIDGKKIPNADALAKRCLTELSSENPEKRNFYFKAYRRMLNTLDEGLSELPAAPVVKYFRTYPLEAIDHYNGFSVKEKDQFVSHLAYDFWVEGNCHNTIPAYINEVLIENPNTKAREQEFVEIGRLMVSAYKD